MTSKHLLLLMGTFLLVQGSLGKALPFDETTAEQEETNEATQNGDLAVWDAAETPSDELLLFVLKSFSKVADSTLKLGSKLLHDVIAEISARDEKSDEITEKLELFSEVAHSIDELQTEYKDDSDEYLVHIQLVPDLSDVLALSNITSIEEPTEADKLFAEALENNGLSNVEEHFKQKFAETFSKDFYVEAKRILNSATSEEWAEKENLQEWLEKFNSEEDVEEKIELLNNFFDFYQEG